MSLEQLKAFLAKVKGDTSLQEKLKAAKSSEDVVAIAKEHGYDFGTDHMSQLSEKELEGVAAAAGCQPDTYEQCSPTMGGCNSYVPITCPPQPK
jgi:predicted ribosomally synthesized peptide with nif11-like leader